MTAFSVFYSTVTLISSALALSLLPWFVRFRSIPGLFVIAWLFVVNLLYGLNAAAFTKATLLRIPVYCDFATKLLMGMQMVMPTAMLCYTFSIHDWLVRPKERDLKVKLLEYRDRFHAALCFVLPIVYMAFHIIVQDHRFDIVEDVGCLPSSSNTALGWVLIWQILLVPFAVFVVYGLFIVRYVWTHQCRYHDSVSRRTIRDMVDGELLFTNSPFGIVRIIRLSVMIAVVMLCTLCAVYYALAIFLRSEGLTLIQKPDLSRIDVFNSLIDASPSIRTTRLFLWSGPLYSILLFAASMDKTVLLSYSFVFRRYVLCQAHGPRPDPIPEIDLSTLTPVPVHKRIYRRVIRKSRMYDPPMSYKDFDIPLPPRPDPGYRTTAALPPVPESATPPTRELRRPEVARVKGGRQRDRYMAPTRTTAFEEAMRKHIQANLKFPMHSIPEAPSPQSSDASCVHGNNRTPAMMTRETVSDMV